ncbi:hypothetical protein [Fictibacillus terranigra]|uniref:Uncharacterized protein n=1 Tax=Fictibacillus terranigra TaxID=3058424 RepID=A0ABT8E593_9BACL|nr:hypothetical protein [Fictibacillus sp. CENA-BCM004]MDN4073077.1 hypothetical protein [Fictibacillus sp. CENA-BCM004]
MKGKWLPVLIIALLLLSSFFVYNYKNAKPPMPKVIAEGSINIPVKQGSYCWDGFLSGECVDMVEPFMMSDKKIIHVKPKEEIRITYNRKPIKESKSVTLWTKNKSEPEEALPMAGGVFLAPRDQGVYAVNTHGIWKQGSASHVFFIKVR